MLFSKTNNKIANQYWEYKLKDMDFVKIQNDDNRLRDFIFDKYERRRWVNTKAPKHPFELVKEGKEVFDSDVKVEEESPEPSPVKKVVIKKEKIEPMPQSSKGDNKSLIDFGGSDVILQQGSKSTQFNNDNNLIFNTTQDSINSTAKQSSFPFINQSQVQVVPKYTGSDNLLDMNSHITEKDTQSKLLLDNISNIYKNPQPETKSTPQVQNSINFLQPNINISNTIYNLGNPQLNNPYGANPQQQINNPYGTNPQQQINNPYGVNPQMMGGMYGMHPQYSGMNSQQNPMKQNPYGQTNNPFSFTLSNPNPSSTGYQQGGYSQNNQDVNLSKFNSTPVNFGQGSQLNGYKPSSQFSGLDLGGGNSSRKDFEHNSKSLQKKEKKDPFESLVSFR